MSFKDKDIIIQCWSGKQLYIGPYDSSEVDIILESNRCDCDDSPDCEQCDGTGYAGDFHIFWVDESDKDGCNVYEYIDY